MDKLDTIFAMQQRLNEDIVARRGLDATSDEEWIQRQALALLAETGEMLNEVNFKWWKNPKPINHDALREELVDMLHFFISMCLRAGMDAQMLYDIYLAKNEENFRRQDGTSAKKGYSMDEVQEAIDEA